MLSIYYPIHVYVQLHVVKEHGFKDMRRFVDGFVHYLPPLQPL